MEHWFWLILCFLTLTWYVLVTAVVGYMGALDIKEMIRTMAKKQEDDEK